MPPYELVLIIQKLERSALKEVLKRTANYIFEVGGTLRSMDNLGLRTIPYSISKNGRKHTSAHYFIFSYDAGEQDTLTVKEKLKIDLDIVRASTFKRAKTLYDLYNKKEEPECTMYLDLLPAPFRPNVIALQNSARPPRRRVRNQKNYEDTDFLLY